MTSELRRDIRKRDLFALVLNCIVGAGIFGLPARGRMHQPVQPYRYCVAGTITKLDSS
jgi:hypothetical protein